jgi:hypothetical protein
VPAGAVRGSGADGAWIRLLSTLKTLMGREKKVTFSFSQFFSFFLLDFRKSQMFEGRLLGSVRHFFFSESSASVHE